MGKYRFIMHEENCINCKACENVCRTTHDTAPGLWLGKLLYTMPEGKMEAQVKFRACPQCNHAKCVSACPTGALIMRESDGIVYVDVDKCTGCGLCLIACPHDLLWKDPRTGKIVKCDMCYERMDQGLQPNCIASCPTNALELIERKPGESLHKIHNNK